MNRRTVTSIGRRCALVAILALPSAAQDAGVAASRPAAEAADGIVRKGVAYLLGAQNADGSWGGVRNKTMTDDFANAETHAAWSVGATGLVIDALTSVGGDDARRAARNGVARLAKSAADLKRCANWDIDNVWGYVFGLQGVARALRDPTLLTGPEREAALAAGRTYLKGLGDYQSPNGGWAYYADPDAAWRPEWATSFTTAAAIVALLEARAAGFVVPARVFDPAVKAVDRCRLPDFAYTYDVMPIPSRRGGSESINHPRGSLGRTQACGYARFAAGREVPEAERRAGVDRFFAEHKFLDCALRKPIPHESWHANAAYFYLFGHYYASRMIGTLPAPEQSAYYAKLVPEIAKTQEPDGGMWDFYISNHTKPYGTAFGILSLLPVTRVKP